jgi:hypothetical protein
MQGIRKKKVNPKLLDKVRKEVLIIRALHDNPAYGSGFGLSAFCNHFSDENRGHIQHCLSLLAKEGIMFERSHTEGYVASYEHRETDKRFRIRISRDDAIAQLEELGIEWKQYIRSEVEERNKYIHRTLF